MPAPIDNRRDVRQSSAMKAKLTMTAIAALAFTAGSAVSFFTLPIWVTFAVNLAREGNRSDWIGFAGSIVGAAMTIVAALVAWWAVDRQIRITKEIAGRDRLELRSIFLQDFEQYCPAIALVWRAVNRALLIDESAAVEKARQDTVLIFLNYLPQLQQIESLNNKAHALSPLDEQRMSQIIWAYKELWRLVEPFAKTPETAIKKRVAYMKSMQFWLSFLASAIESFDPKFARIFEGFDRRPINPHAVIAYYKQEWEAALTEEEMARRKEAKIIGS